MNFDWLRQRAAATPEKVALIIEDASWTYAELDRLTDAMCEQLRQVGVQAGQLVAVLMTAGLDYVSLIHALARLQATLVPLNTRLTIPELTWQLNFTKSTFLVHDEAEAERAAVLGEQCSVFSIQCSVVGGQQDKGLAGQQASGSASQQVSESASQQEALNPQLPITNYQLPISQSPNLPISNYPITQLPNPQLQAIVFTSGTTGHPKGVQLTFNNHFWSANASAYRLGVLPTDRWVSCLPLYHVGGLAVIFRSCLYGTAVILHPRFDLDAINHSLDQQVGTMISVVPTMLYRLLDSRDHWPIHLRLILLGGAAASPELVERANGLPRGIVSGSASQQEALDPQLPISQLPNYPITQLPNTPITQYTNPPLVATTYGLTEASSQVATQTPADTVRKPGSVGKALMFSSVRIVDENGRSLPTNEIGEVVVAGTTVMQGYFQNEEATAKTIKNGELYTGDVGYLDEDGDLWLVQRRSDIIVSGGENVYPAEVEKVYKAHPAVTAVCVVGVPNAEWGEVVSALIVLADGASVSADELVAYGRKQLAGYKQPRHIQFINQLPLTASGKIARQAVKEYMEKKAGD